MRLPKKGGLRLTSALDADTAMHLRSDFRVLGFFFFKCETGDYRDAASKAAVECAQHETSNYNKRRRSTFRLRLISP